MVQSDACMHASDAPTRQLAPANVVRKLWGAESQSRADSTRTKIAQGN
jgi:hypothetical protein